jgi:DNA-binding response OmpR family regulator
MMNNKKTILIAEDEENILSFLSRGLQDYGYQTSTFSNGNDAWEYVKDIKPSLLLLDIRMPGMTGLELCQKFRERYGYATPVIMLTALGTTDDIVMGLHAGADDYVIKPFKFIEVLARIKSALRRSDIVPIEDLSYHDLHLNSVTHQAIRGNMTVDLSVKEFRLLSYFIQHHEELLSRRQLLKDVWDRDFDTNTNVVDVYVRYIREKIDDKFNKKLIHTVVGLGYTMK